MYLHVRACRHSRVCASMHVAACILNLWLHGTVIYQNTIYMNEVQISKAVKPGSQYDVRTKQRKDIL